MMMNFPPLSVEGLLKNPNTSGVWYGREADPTSVHG